MTTFKRRAGLLLALPFIVALILIEAGAQVIDELADLCLRVMEDW